MTTSQSAAPPPPWDIQAARALYNIQRWGAHYFDINEAGHVVAMPLREAGAVVTDADGEPWTPHGSSICTANPTLHAEMLEVLAASAARP